MAKVRKKKTKKSSEIPIEGTQPSDKIKQYFHNYTKRINNPPVGLVTPETDTEMPTKQYSYDHHLDPQLIWSGKKEHASFEVDTVSLHVHERVDPMTIVEKILKTPRSEFVQKTLFEFFNSPENNPPLREAIEFYKHDQSWSNRLIAGDSLLVMNSLLQKEGLEGKVQMIYIDPPYGIKYGSNFQPFVNKKEVKDQDTDLSREPETVRAFRDTWELGIHSYLTYLRDRLFLARDLLTESGSCFVQISDENVHLIRNLMDEVFGSSNFVRLISFRKKSMPLGGKVLEEMNDYLVWYAKDKSKIKYRQLYKETDVEGLYYWRYAQLPNGEIITLSTDQVNNHELLPKEAQIARIVSMTPPTFNEKAVFPVSFKGKEYLPSGSGCWITNKEGMERLMNANRLVPSGKSLSYLYKLSDFPYAKVTSPWDDTGSGNFTDTKIYVVQTSYKVIQRCLLMVTDPGDLIFDPTCGSGTTAFVAEQWGRRWITCDTSRVAITLAKQRLMTSVYKHYELARPNEGIGSGFKYKTIPHITLRSIANNDSADEEILFDQPLIDNSKTRICGPFMVEAVPYPTVKAFDNTSTHLSTIDSSLARIGETIRQDEWRNELLKTGIRGKGGQKIEFSRVEVLSGTQWLHADAETKEKEPKRIVVSFGPDHAPLEQKQIARGIEEAQKLVPKPKIVVFAAFHFDPEAAKDIDELNWPGVTILKAQMNTDLLTEDLRKERSSNESFWLMGQPDIELKKTKDSKYVVEVNGFDYYNTKTGEIESGNSSRIAMWMLDTDYDGRSLYPQQIFFPMSGSSDGWSKLGKSLKTEINEELLEQYRGTKSLPFVSGSNKQVAVKIIDDRGIESLRILKVE